jgi:carboxylesterase type B
MQTLLNAELVTVRGDLGDQWLPAVDGDFWPAAPSEMLRDGRFVNVTTMIRWTQDDLTLYTNPSIESAQDTYDSVHAGYPGMSADNIEKLLALYPVTDFASNLAANKSSEFYRAARISRDIFMVCQVRISRIPFFYPRSSGKLCKPRMFYGSWIIDIYTRFQTVQK